ncbi:hypothetical protein QTP86_013149 [Hemibagrus guttatus]|nr:hypothetical protein QTP86_013149 [Hemibagrus guttatus]
MKLGATVMMLSRCLRSRTLSQTLRGRTVTILHGIGESQSETPIPRKGTVSQTKPVKVKRYCPFCDKTEHYLSQCASFTKLTSDQVRTWIHSNNRCWRCARAHHATQCNLKKPCNICQGTHLRPLHEVNVNPSHKEDSANVEKSCLTNSSPDRFFLDKPSVGGRVMLKVVPVNLHYEDRTLDTFALLDDGLERTILLSTAVKALGIQGVPEELPLWTVRDDIQVLNGSSISFQISPLCKPQTCYKINHAFTAERLNLSRQSYPVEQLQQKYRHLRGLPIRTFMDVQPLLLIGSDQPHLITPTEPVRWRGPGRTSRSSHTPRMDPPGTHTFYGLDSCGTAMSANLNGSNSGRTLPECSAAVAVRYGSAVGGQRGNPGPSKIRMLFSFWK